MVRQQIVRVRRLVTLHFVLLAFLTATLVASGSNSAFLPLLVLVVGVSSFLFVDWFEWFSLHHFFAYAGMLLGTILALRDYFMVPQSDPVGQLYSIATLLIYPEIVIMLQRKNMRLFEQLAMFLLLQIIVAALVNDTVLFGFLLIPLVLLWVSALLLLTRYAALIQLAPDLDRPTPRLIEVLADAWRKARKRRQTAPEKMLGIVQPEESWRGQIRHRTLLGQSAPIGIVCLLFAGLYFYLLPRATLDGANYGMGPRTGFSETLTLGSMGKMLQDSSLVMRVAFRDSKTGQPYRLITPPYIRGTVVSRYSRQARSASFESREQLLARPSDRFDPLSADEFSLAKVNGDRVVAKFDIISPDGSVMPCVAPMLNHDRSRSYMHLLPFEWRLINGRSDLFPGRRSQSYSLLTTGFRRGSEWPVLPDSRQLLHRPSRNSTEALLASLSTLTLQRGEYSTGWIEDLLKRVRKRHPGADDPIGLARAIEETLSSSGEFTYSLSLRVATDHELDPIEDFIVNQKKGHCQYFAAALTMILRHQRIPTRIVLGYHPLEYNELGDYFTVRKSDAHAWVEAYFTADQLRRAGLYTDDLGEMGGWLRLDPTPAGPGSNAGNNLRTQEDQGIDFANRFWSEWVINSRQRAEDNSLYEPLQESTRETYSNMLEFAREALQRIHDSQVSGETGTRGSWFSWPVAILVIFTGGLAVFAWRFARALPRWAPELAKKFGFVLGLDDVGQHFYRHCLRLLHRAGFVRHASQTAAEYTDAAAQQLAVREQWPQASEELSTLTGAYYRLRFGGSKSLPPDENQRVATALEHLERNVKK